MARVAVRAGNSLVLRHQPHLHPGRAGRSPFPLAGSDHRYGHMCASLRIDTSLGTPALTQATCLSRCHPLPACCRCLDRFVHLGSLDCPRPGTSGSCARFGSNKCTHRDLAVTFVGRSQAGTSDASSMVGGSAYRMRLTVIDLLPLRGGASDY